MENRGIKKWSTGQREELVGAKFKNDEIEGDWIFDKSKSEEAMNGAYLKILKDLIKISKK